MTTEHRQVVVIGAGISGLACAYRLKALGVDVLLLEGSSRVGGVIQSERIDGFLIERGPSSSQGTEELMALIDELGILDELAEGDPKAPAYVYFSNTLHRVPSGLGSFVGSKLLSLRGKLRIFLEPLIRVRKQEAEESVASFAGRRIGREAAERMVAPFVSGIYAGDAEKLSVQAAFPRLANLEAKYGGLIRGSIAKAREASRAKKSAAAVLDKAAPTRRRLISFREGMDFLPRKLASALGEDLMQQCSGITLQTDNPGQGSSGAVNFRIVFERAGSTFEVECARVVVATPARAAAKLIGGVSPELSDHLAEIEYPPLSVVSLSYDVASIKTPLDGFGFLVAPSEGLNILGCVWNSSLFDNRAPEGKALLTSFVGGARRPDLARLADAELVSAVHADLRKVLGISSEPRVISITRHERSIPQYNLGHAGRVRSIESLLVKVPGLGLTGNYLHGVSTGDCVKQAEEVARNCADSLSGQGMTDSGNSSA
jgi:protoporphyrinogen/coproporphyrinogen III oxidase